MADDLGIVVVDGHRSLTGKASTAQTLLASSYPDRLILCIRFGDPRADGGRYVTSDKAIGHEVSLVAPLG